MPNTQVQPPTQTSQTQIPAPTAITPALLKQHSITPDEYARIEASLGRTPSLTELGIFSVMWSEHCSYKSSRVHLKRLPTKSERVVQGPGENAGIIDVGDGWACAFKIESHNHPSYIEPHQGAATGVGGILRDIFTMNARPLAVMDSLRFGPLDEAEPDEALRSKNHQIATGVVHGVASYGNCFGVPNLGGETRFEACYSGNPLLNAFALGLVKIDEIFYAKAVGVGNPVIYVGAKTGRDGIHGATMASEEFTEGSEQKRPNVQMGDPFMEKLLLEACLEAMATGAVLGIQDMGAAGLTCSTCEMGARGELGLTVELDRVPQRETGMSSYEIMLSESQERMLLVADKTRAQEVLDVFTKWGLDASIVGEVTAEPNMRITQHGELVADIPNKFLTDDAPVYRRPVGEWKAPVPIDPPAHVLEELKKPRDYTADLKKLLASANICDKRWVYEQYDSMVQTNTVQGPGGEAGVMRIKGTPRGLAMALAGNGRWCYLDPKLGAMHAVAEAARKVACTGATPVAATNCLNFGNPEKPEIMAQLSAAIDGIAEACTALGTPVTGGNVSLYNETKGEGIYPTPVLGIVGIIDDVTKSVPSGFQKGGERVILLSAKASGDNGARLRQFGSSDYANSVLGAFWGAPPKLDLGEEAELNKCLTALAHERLITSAGDVSDGGIAVALAKACIAKGVGAAVSLDHLSGDAYAAELFAEEASMVVATCTDEAFLKLVEVCGRFGSLTVRDVGTTGGKMLDVFTPKGSAIADSVTGLRSAWMGALESQLAGEVMTA
ncbi:phosphoribosylformylglycinamidine synthase subunit PurL [Edaphobacter acidisoli]|uniref:Phosphoribosylformylglycinamidine synthase subunit PurL n=1 Tax=Edaphobacter acidisoli TaxID=2040573 RepID=A0A916RW80_9BACT|nr:phosphoribosylformylglycinamidine synthase subunit PurL [Edaphobacter acidisoli]GGA69833.1 phosphoribosylformylglycinamidine synthase subunit PurL [Edaphobacter acidisoli]